jgi:uncharacterized membrane-anchored protein
MCLAQMAVPGKIIADYERLARTGTPFRFQTQPIDPADPFRGKYITLSFLADHARDTSTWSSGEAVNVVFSTDSAGYATVDKLTREEPDGPYLHTTITYVDSEDNVHFDLPFDRFYMEETKAKPAEDAYRQASRDSTHTCYGIVHIGQGRAVITDVLIDEISVNE